MKTIKCRFALSDDILSTKAPNGLAILSRTFPDGEARNKALAIYTACAPLGSTIGTVVGSLLSCMFYGPLFVRAVIEYRD